MAGEEDINSPAYNIINQVTAFLPENESVYRENEQMKWCKVGAAAKVSIPDSRAIFDAYRLTKSIALLDKMLLAMELRIGSDSVFSQELKHCSNDDKVWTRASLEGLFNNDLDTNNSIYTWQNTEHWAVVKEAIIKDKDEINRAAAEFGVQPRLLVSVVIVEQLRLYYTQR